jgi:hypothetical protein
MTMHMHQLYQVSAEQALLGLHGLKIRIFISIREERRKRERKVKGIPSFFCHSLIETTSGQYRHKKTTAIDHSIAVAE